MTLFLVFLSPSRPVPSLQDPFQFIHHPTLRRSVVPILNSMTAQGSRYRGCDVASYTTRDDITIGFTLQGTRFCCRLGTSCSQHLQHGRTIIRLRYTCASHTSSRNVGMKKNVAVAGPEALAAATMKNAVFGNSCRFGGTYFLHFQDRRVSQARNEQKHAAS